MKMVSKLTWQLGSMLGTRKAATAGREEVAATPAQRPQSPPEAQTPNTAKPVPPTLTAQGSGFGESSSTAVASSPSLSALGSLSACSPSTSSATASRPLVLHRDALLGEVSWIVGAAAGKQAAQGQGGDASPAMKMQESGDGLKFTIRSSTWSDSHPYTGKEPHAEVRRLIQIVGGSKLAIAVFCGHGPDAEAAAEFARKHFEQGLSVLPSSSQKEAIQGLVSIFESTQWAMQYQMCANRSGVSATVAILDPKARVMSVAHVGDSTLGLYTADTRRNLVFSTSPHTVQGSDGSDTAVDAAELRAHAAEREKRGQSFGVGPCARQLPVSRCLGDRSAQLHGASSDPEVTEQVPLFPGCKLVLASRGLWRRVSLERAAELAVLQRSCQESVNTLVAEASPLATMRGEVHDDIAAIVIRMA